MINTSATIEHNTPGSISGQLGQSYDLPSPEALDINPPQKAYTNPISSYEEKSSPIENRKSENAGNKWGPPSRQENNETDKEPTFKPPAYTPPVAAEPVIEETDTRAFKPPAYTPPASYGAESKEDSESGSFKIS